MGLFNQIQNINEANDFDCQSNNFEGLFLGDVTVKSSSEKSHFILMEKFNIWVEVQIKVRAECEI